MLVEWKTETVVNQPKGEVTLATSIFYLQSMAQPNSAQMVHLNTARPPDTHTQSSTTSLCSSAQSWISEDIKSEGVQLNQ